MNSEIESRQRIMTTENMRFKVMTVTPKLAEQWLSTRAPNRRMSLKRVQDYAASIRRGEFLCTHQSIAFDSNGLLVDGQHRLQAIVEAGTPIRIGVTHGLDPKAMDVVDSGMVRRNVDHLYMRGVESPKYISEYTAMCGFILSRFRPTRFDMHEFDRLWAAFGPGVNWAAKKFSGKRPFSRAAIAGTFAFAHRSSPSKVDEFANMVISGAGLGKHSPALKLRNTLMAGRLGAGAVARKTIAEQVMQAVCAHLSGETLSRFTQSDQPLEFLLGAYGDFDNGNGNRKE